MQLGDTVTTALLAVGAIAGVGGLIGGFFAGRRAGILGSVLMGIIGGIVAAAIARVMHLPPVVDAGDGYSLVYGLGGGILLAIVVGSSNR